MPRYHFNVLDAWSIPDEVGTELPSLMAARIEAVRLSAGLLANAAETFWDAGEWRLVVTDPDGLILFDLLLFATEAPVAGKL
jgi:hypothetical protein